MKRIIVTGLLAVGLVSAGWTAGRAAQVSQGANVRRHRSDTRSVDPDIAEMYDHRG